MENVGNDGLSRKPHRPRFRGVRASEIERKRIEWLWRGMIPRGSVTLLTGDPQAGKSTIVCELAAKLSQGEPLPGESDKRTPEGTWILSSEDGADDTIVWRLGNQGADLSRIRIDDERVELDKTALAEMEDIISRENISLVVLDTMTTWLGAEVDMNRMNHVADWTNPLRDIARRTGCSFLLLRHRRKTSGNGGEKALYAGIGSIGFTAAARSELTASVNKDGERRLQRTKGNVGMPPEPVEYVIEEHSDPANDHGILSWRKATLGEGGPPIARKPLKLQEAVNFLRSFLADGPKNVLAILQEGAKLNLSQKTLERAKKELRGTSTQVGKGVWEWALPSDGQEEEEED